MSHLVEDIQDPQSLCLQHIKSAVCVWGLLKASELVLRLFLKIPCLECEFHLHTDKANSSWIGGLGRDVAQVHFTLICLRLHFDVTVHFDFTSISLRFHFDDTSIALRLQLEITLLSSRFHFDVTSTSLRFQVVSTSSSLRFQVNFSTTTLRFRLDLTSGSRRLHTKFISNSHRF